MALPQKQATRSHSHTTRAPRLFAQLFATTLLCATALLVVTVLLGACSDDTTDPPDGCADGLTACGVACVDVNNDGAHCGACNVACAADEVCNGTGQCVLVCPAELIDCDGACIDPLTDDMFCGASEDCQGANAGTICPAGESCTDGACGCALNACGGCLVAEVDTVPSLVTADTSTGQDDVQPSCAGDPSASDRSWAFTAPQAGRYTFDSRGSAYDTLLTVRDEACAELACNANVSAPEDTTARIDVQLAAGQRILVTADGNDPQSSGVATLNMASLYGLHFGDTNSDVGQDVAVDAAGNVYVTGYFEGTVNFGGGDLVSAGSRDIFVAKYDASGKPIWSKRFGSTGLDAGVSVALDPSGNVMVGGYLQGTVNLGGADLISAGSSDIFVAAFDASGSHIWSKSFGGTNFDFALGVASDAGGNLIVAGYFQNTVTFDSTTLVSAGSNDIFVAKFDAAGSALWSQRFGGTGDDQARSMAVDAAGNVLVAGLFEDTVDFGGGGLVSAGNNDIFVAKYDGSGTHVWSTRAGGTGFDHAVAVAAGADGNVLVTGHFSNTVNFGGGDLVSAGTADVFVAMYDGAGGHLWSNGFGGVGFDRGYGVALDAAGNVLVTGSFEATVNFGGGDFVSMGNADIFAAKYTASGSHLWSKRFGGAGFDRGHGVAADAAGNMLVTGYFESMANFGDGQLVSAGFEDIFLTALGR